MHSTDIKFTSGDAELPGQLVVPTQAHGVVIFAHGSGSSRHSPRNKYVANYLNNKGFATLLFDLLSVNEESNRNKVFDIPLLSKRLIDATEWVRSYPTVKLLPIGFFGASTGAAAALIASATLGKVIGAVVCRGGRVDLARDFFPRVISPTLLIVGEADDLVLELNQAASNELTCISHISVISRATHLFEEPGALEKVCEKAGDWFALYLGSQKGQER